MGFPFYRYPPLAKFFLLIAAAVYALKKPVTKFQQLVSVSVIASALLFYLLNASFYTQLLTYQAGNELAFKTKEKVDPATVYLWPGVYSSSYNFYTSELRKEYHDSVLQHPGPIWIMVDGAKLPELGANGLPSLEMIEQRDYEITMLKMEFIDPSKRDEVTIKYFLVRVK